ncbi:DNA-binding Lrp family transcriptional regulator [Chitinivorax tropicus]|uniref:DNA-binding Lrp family transcriptional regulator n=2 Tax=Chitinivorax tropicus TaxID=714531 RepID=A0A840MMC8_9PROT|nr:DNA-binding Lrp family transcriptional regulator [Chitinivorax tropicus]
MSSINFDRFDVQILDALQHDARSTHQKLSQTIPLSPSQIGRRIQRLEEAGVIDSYRVNLRPERLGLSVLAFINVFLDHHGEAVVRDFASAVADLPEVLEAYAVSGEADYWLRVQVPDLPSLSRFVMHTLMCVPSVRSVKSTIALEPVKRSAPLPLGHA